MTTIDCVLWPPGLHEYDVGLLVQLAVNVTGVPGATGAEGVAPGKALIVQTGRRPLLPLTLTVMLTTALQKFDGALLHA